VIIFINDIWIRSNSHQQHDVHLITFLSVLKEKQLMFHVKKIRIKYAKTKLLITIKTKILKLLRIFESDGQSLNNLITPLL